MMRALYAGVSGLKAHQRKMDVVGNNIANVNTVGFKRSTISFQDMLSQTIKESIAPGDGTGGINPMQVGTGVMVGSINPIFSQGANVTTGNNTDVMIQGDGFFALSDGSDNQYYTRAGAFSFDSEGYLINSANGMHVLDDGGSEIEISDIEEATEIMISPTGDITYTLDGEREDAGVKIGVTRFTNPEGLKKVGQNMYIESDNSGEANLGEPGEEGRGNILEGQLEASNVDLASEFSDMIITQRGFQANAKTIKTADEMLQEVANIKR